MKNVAALLLGIHIPNNPNKPSRVLAENRLNYSHAISHCTSLNLKIGLRTMTFSRFFFDDDRYFGLVTQTIFFIADTN